MKHCNMKMLLTLLIAVLATSTTFAQKAKANKKTPGSAMAIQSIYRCPMHPHVVSNEAGKCGKCNMDLTFSKKEQMKKENTKDYTCPMHNEVVDDTAGTCAKCGTALVVVNRKGSKQGNTVYVCSMHSEIVRDKSGKCPKCGMELTKAKE